MPLPITDVDFAFGVCRMDDPKHLEVLDLEHSDPPEMQRLTGSGSEIDFALVIQGFNIWSEVSRWVSNARNQAGSTSLTESPETINSFWTRSLRALEDWRAIQPPQFHYSLAGSHLQAFISRKQGERYCLVNLIYFLTTIFLYRECVPLLHRDAQETASSETAFSREAVFVNWPKDSANRLSESALSTIRMMDELTSQGLNLHVPFTCYCVFNAVTILSYIRRWPATNLQSESALESFNWGFEWLSKASQIWEVAAVWKSTLTKLESSYNYPHAESRNFPRSEAEIESLSDLAIPAVGQELNRRSCRPGIDQNTESSFSIAARPDTAVLDDISRWGPSASYSDLPWLSIDGIPLDYELMVDALVDFPHGRTAY
ncbi:unnamed protein product [Aspergillus oryzae RIB40]|uniref:DNA, SC011 n=1 Tax=Aspergillus oryzae (strain ATCC 42149 / RIB 40) TaxID=510516 RepID=Q2TZX0_ASPOR|nr:unnamed protein product [Aspergillus oryzae RIB40]BAE65145.1 unnamed protein product [Aspergillus oryzae RIB40]